ncbi:MAG: histidinol phosphate phosphatase domain-containing protein [Candidatus Margulisiibacteriota bacterium]
MHPDIGSRIELHAHTTLSDGHLLPAALAIEAKYKGNAALAITDHIDYSNVDFATKSIVNFCREAGDALGIKIIPGAEISYVNPKDIKKLAVRARKLGAKIIVVHGQSVNEPAVPPGTNHAAVQLKGLVNILAHPGQISVEDVMLAKQNGIYLEISAREGHKRGNQFVAKLAKQYGAKLLVNTDAHTDHDLITQEEALKIAQDAGLSYEEALVAVRDNPRELILKL